VLYRDVAAIMKLAGWSHGRGASVAPSMAMAARHGASSGALGVRVEMDRFAWEATDDLSRDGNQTRRSCVWWDDRVLNRRRR